MKDIPAENWSPVDRDFAVFSNIMLAQGENPQMILSTLQTLSFCWLLWLLYKHTTLSFKHPALKSLVSVPTSIDRYSLLLEHQRQHGKLTVGTSIANLVSVFSCVN